MSKAIRDGEIRRGAMVSAVSDVVSASEHLDLIEVLRSKRSRQNIEDIRPSVANDLRISSATVERYKSKRNKTVPSWLMAKIRACLIDELQNILRAIEHDKSVYLQAGGDPREDRFAEAVASAVHARKILDAAIGTR